ncbi:PH domain-containing protein [Parabacteroides chinchillae]|uniref:PH domain-containing protein n=1 Tax=Parabacteroides chinchillae TaxID=871327 RepID=A0A8G2F4I8_9BACT|nr:PH domain-containing protein [Parabacteroides chinchillae]SEF70952.1 PH domain-containing protein [Parabacteroides chinchillae]
MDRVFKSKVGWWFHLGLLIIIAVCIRAFLSTNVAGMIVGLLTCMLLIHMLLNTWYKITEDGQLVVHCSIFPEKRIAVSDITAVETTVMPVSSYALSLDRLIIYKNGFQWMLVSPTNKKEFLKLLRKHNPDIQIKEPVI